MKKIYCFLILAIVLLPIVNAGKTFELDFNTKDSFPLVMDKGDRILFEYGGYNHTIILDEIKFNDTRDSIAFSSIIKVYQVVGLGCCSLLDYSGNS